MCEDYILYEHKRGAGASKRKEEEARKIEQTPKTLQNNVNPRSNPTSLTPPAPPPHHTGRQTHAKGFRR